MCAIAIIELTEYMFNRQEFEKHTDVDLFFFENKKVNLNKINGMNGIIFCSNHEGESAELFNLILSIKKDSSIPMWTFLKNYQPLTKKNILHLGILDNFTEKTPMDEMAIMVKNAMNIVYTIQNKRIVESKPLSTSKKIDLNPLNLEFVVQGEKIGLTKIEYALVDFLHQNVNQTCTYEEIYSYIWNGSCEGKLKQYKVSNVLFHLRNKLKEHGKSPQIFKTIRSIGYMLNDSIIE